MSFSNRVDFYVAGIIMYGIYRVVDRLVVASNERLEIKSRSRYGVEDSVVKAIANSHEELLQEVERIAERVKVLERIGGCSA